MLRPIGYFAVAFGLLFLCAHFAVWRLMWQLALIMGLFAWCLVGAAMLAARLKRTHANHPRGSLSPLEAAAADARQYYVSKHGEDAAASVDRENPRLWLALAAQKMGRK